MGQLPNILCDLKQQFSSEKGFAFPTLKGLLKFLFHDKY